MVALRRPDDLPVPGEDGLPVRAIKAHTLEKLDYWGRYINAASTATTKRFPGARVCTDLFAAFGVCEDTRTKRRVWGSPLIALQVDVAYDLYIFNDVNPAATAALAERARRIGASGAVIFELDLREPDWREHAREIKQVVAPWGPKVVITTGDANTAHFAVKALEPDGWRYLCAIVDPQEAIYEWSALEALAYGERAMDVLMLFPDEMDMGRGLNEYLGGDGAKLDRCFGPADWRAAVCADPRHAPSALRSLYEEQMKRLLGFKIGRPKTVEITKTRRALYRLVFGSRNKLGITIWESICRRTPGEQYEMWLPGV